MAISELPKILPSINKKFKKNGRKEDLTGRRFGMMTVLYEADLKIHGRVAWVCVCDCGKIKNTTAKCLKSGDTKSCGCLHVAHALQHVKQNEKQIGYKRIKKQSGRPEIKTKSGFKMEHRVVAEAKIGRKLLPNEVVHHKDFNKLNNHPDNLEIMDFGEHSTLHNKQRGQKDV